MHITFIHARVLLLRASIKSFTLERLILNLRHLTSFLCSLTVEVDFTYTCYFNDFFKVIKRYFCNLSTDFISKLQPILANYSFCMFCKLFRISTLHITFFFQVIFNLIPPNLCHNGLMTKWSSYCSRNHKALTPV